MGHILQVVTDTDRRGAQVFATDLHAALERRGLRVRTVALAEGAVGGLDVPVLGPSRTHRSTLRALRAEAARATVVAAHGSTTLPMCALACPAARTPFVYRQISDSLFWASSPLRRARVALALQVATRVVALWTGSAQTLHRSFGVPRSKIDVVPNGVPVEDYPPVDPREVAPARKALGLRFDRPTVLSIGALVPEKGVDVTIDAVARIANVQLAVVGDGPERAALEARAKRGLGERAVFTGSIHDPRAAYAAADVVALPSRGGDSMPAVLIEAGLAALPSVATPIEGIVDIVVDGVTGRLVDVDDVDGLRTALVDVLTDGRRASELGANARRHCLERFDIDVVAQRWEQSLRAASGAPPLDD